MVCTATIRENCSTHNEMSPMGGRGGVASRPWTCGVSSSIRMSDISRMRFTAFRGTDAAWRSRK